MGDAKLREVLQRHGTRYAMVLRDNELDRILCMARRPRVDTRGDHEPQLALEALGCPPSRPCIVGGGLSKPGTASAHQEP